MKWVELERPKNADKFAYHKWTMVGKYRVSTYKTKSYLPSISYECETTFINHEDVNNHRVEMTKFWDNDAPDEKLEMYHMEMCKLAEKLQELQNEEKTL